MDHDLLAELLNERDYQREEIERLRAALATIHGFLHDLGYEPGVQDVER